MSDSVRPEVAAFQELEPLVRHLGDELARFRHRALVAEGKLRELDGKSVQPSARHQRELADRCTALEQENATLTSRLEAATSRARKMLDRVRFIRQQTQGGGGAER